MGMTIPVMQEVCCFTNTLLSSCGYHVYWKKYCFSFIFLGVHCQVCGRKQHFHMHVCQMWPCHNPSGYLLASHLRSPGSILGQSVSDLWWTRCRWDWFSSGYFGFLIPPMLHVYLPSSNYPYHKDQQAKPGNHLTK